MALDSRELQQLATLLGDVLAPRIREAVAENVTVRIAALAQTLRDEQRGALDAAQIATARLVSESTEALGQKIFENGVQSTEFLNNSTNVTKAFIADQITSLDEKIATKLTANEEKFEIFTSGAIVDSERLSASIAEVRNSIPVMPVIPEPTKLLEGGELSESMRAAMDVAMRQVMQPVFSAMLVPVAESLSTVETGLTKHSEAVASVARAASGDVDALDRRIANELAVLAKGAASKEELAALDSSVAEAIGKTRAEVLAETKGEIDTRVEVASSVASQRLEDYMRIADELIALGKDTASKAELAALNCSVDQIIVKTRAEILAETKGEIEIAVRLASDEIDELDKRIDICVASTKGAASKEELTEVTKIFTDAVTGAKDQVEVLTGIYRVATDDINTLDKRITGELVALASVAASKEDLTALDSRVAETVAKTRTEVLVETKGGIEIVASIARAASADLDALDKRIAGELASLTVSSREELKVLDSRVSEDIAKACTEVSTDTKREVETIASLARAVVEDVDSLDKRIANWTRLSATEVETLKENIKALDSSVSDAIIKTRADLLAETKGDVQALESTTESRLQSLADGATRLQDAIGEAQHATATVQVQLEAGLQAVREEAVTWGAEINRTVEAQREDIKFLADQNLTKEAVDSLRSEMRSVETSVNDVLTTKIAQTHVLIEQVRTDAASAVLAEHIKLEEGAKEIVEEVGERLIGFRTNVESLRLQHAEFKAQLEHVDKAIKTNAEDTVLITDVIKGAVDSTNSMQVDMLELISSYKVQQSAEIEGVRNTLTESQTAALAGFETRLSETTVSIGNSIEHAVNLESGRLSQIFIETDAAAKQAANSRFEILEASGKELYLEINVVEGHTVDAMAAIAALALRTTETEKHALEFATKADKRIEAAHARVKEFGSEMTRNLDAVRTATAANTDAIATKTTSDEIADALAIRTGEVLAARATELEVQIQEVAAQLTKDVVGIRTNFAVEIETARAQFDTSIREMSDSLTRDQTGREATNHEKTIELVAGARVEAQGSVEALRAEHVAAQERFATEHSRLATSIEESNKQTLANITQLVDDSAQLTRQDVTAISTKFETELELVNHVTAKALSDAEISVTERLDAFTGRLAASDSAASDLRELIGTTRAQTLVQLEAGLQRLSDENVVGRTEVSKTITELRDFSTTSFDSLQTTVNSAVESMRQAYATAEEKLASIRAEFDSAVEVMRAHADTGFATMRDEVKQTAYAIGADVTDRLGATFVQLDAVQKSTLDATDALAAEMPDKIMAAVMAFEMPLRTVASDKALLTFNEALPGLLAQAREAAIGAVPAAVVAQTEHLPETLRASLAPLVIAEATRVATEAGEAALGAARGLAEGALTGAKAAGDSAIERARQEAATIARVEATAAAQGLREDLVAALDPVEFIAKSIREAVPLEVQDAVRKYVGEIEPRLYIDLAAKIQKEIDRIPRPRDGLPGTHGTHGKDARVAAPVPYERGKRYDFGAWVAHANGIWVAARNTDAEPIADSADWDCVTPGIKSIESVLQEDGRTVELHFELTNGALHKSMLKMPVQIPRGVYDPERMYDVHDLCTFDGSQWVALKAGKLLRPGSDVTWKLQVKHGKDGKDLKQPVPQVIRHVGEWLPDVEYQTNVTVDHAGVRWLAMRTTRERPPFTKLTSNDTWTKLGS